MTGGRTGAPPQRLAHAMHDAWIPFARTGDPGWPAYDAEHPSTIRFDTAPPVVLDPHGEERVRDGRRRLGS
ncbi:hypothetical protein [Streptomyces sp. HUAS TT7]|uniref:hypothetical protein n=1 Tax=Streptomyces sp. HUAS TT7 TaxID=3447507 RepID=UPI003F65B41B